MSVIVFTGPTLSAADGAALLDGAVFLPPVAQGDVYRASQEKPWAIGIIDGYFERLPSVWHKEILWAMAHGVHVFGSASMGALRAAELHPFGMAGVGAVFEAFRSGALTDDDEVAIAHAPAEDGYRPLSDAMVNIRATLDAAVAASALRRETAAALVALAKRTFYAQRSFARLLAEGAAAGAARPEELDALRRFLPDGRVDQKRRDAVAMLEAIAALRARDPGPLRVAYHFAYTDVWDQACRRAGRGSVAAGQGARAGESAAPDARPGGGPAGARSRRAEGALQPELLLDELRLEGPLSYAHAVHGALARALALSEARRHGVEVPVELFEEILAQIRRERGLLTSESTRAWLAEQALDVEGLTLLVQREARLRWAQAVFGIEVERLLVDHLRMTGRYAELAARALEKQEVLAAAGVEAPALEDLGLTRQALLDWYFGEVAGRPVPPHLDGYAASLGLDDQDELLLVLAREHERRRRARPPAGG
ncbi:TfuA-like protein [Sorangium sp. So ce834]|uniref:TfuA-like protein n=1 Tax=Sorangium sp. So ce834 TaxID=3133321 RepID=UPI003F5F99CB